MGVNIDNLPVCACSLEHGFERGPAHLVRQHSDEHGPCSVDGCPCERYRHISSAGLPPPKTKIPRSTLPEAEEELALQIRGSKVIPPPERGLKFHPLNRRWEIDFAWPWRTVIDTTGEYPQAAALAVEIEGWGHKTTPRFTSDLRKYRAVVAAGFDLYRFSPAEVGDRVALVLLEAIFSGADLVELTNAK